jgi:hypothetical protein
MKTCVKIVSVALTLTCLLRLVVLAQDDGSLFGTNSVSFAPLQVGGSLRGCTLVYEAVVADHAYLGGNPVQAVGNLTVYVQDPSVTLALKLGVRSILGRDQRFEAPHFAYLQSANSSTAKLRYVSGDGEEGFGLFIVRLDDQALKLLMETLQARKVVVGFNRKEGGLDVLVPLDLTVVKTASSGDKAQRTRSSEPVQAFGQCVLKALKEAR